MEVKEAIWLIEQEKKSIIALQETGVFANRTHEKTYYEALKMAISALRKEEPKKPTHEASLYRCLTCPNCKNVIDHFEEIIPGQKSRILYKHCHFCGQKIDWSD